MRSPVFVTVGLFPGQLLRHRLIGQLLRLFPLCQVLFLLRGQVTLQPNDFRKAGSDLGPGKANLFTVLFPPADALAIKGFFAVMKQPEIAWERPPVPYSLLRKSACSLDVCVCVKNAWMRSLLPTVSPPLPNAASSSSSVIKAAGWATWVSKELYSLRGRVSSRSASAICSGR